MTIDIQWWHIIIILFVSPFAFFSKKETDIIDILISFSMWAISLGILIGHFLK